MLLHKADLAYTPSLALPQSNWLRHLMQNKNIVGEMLKYAIIILSALFSGVCQSSDWKTFTDNMDGATFMYPAIWEILPQKTGEFVVFVGEKSGIRGCTLTLKFVPQIRDIPVEKIINDASPEDFTRGAR